MCTQRTPQARSLLWPRSRARLRALEAVYIVLDTPSGYLSLVLKNSENWIKKNHGRSKFRRGARLLRPA